MPLNSSKIAKIIPFAVGAAGILLLGLWVSSTRPAIKSREPGMDQSDNVAGGGSGGKSEGKLVKGTGTAAELPGDWPAFRGPNGDNISTETTPALAKAWPAGGPPVLWKIDVGEGFAGAAIHQGRVYLMDYDRENQADAFRCLSLADGREIWRYTYPVKIKRNHGMSRTIPCVSDKYAIALGPKCHLTCLDPVTGELKWKLNLATEFNVEIPQWYAGQCPRMEGDRLILGIGGSALVAALDCATGKVIWKTPNPEKWQMTHSTVAPMDLAGRKLYLYCGSRGVVGVAAEDGKLLWDTTEWKISIANIPTPLPVGDGRVFLCGGYNAGSMMLQLNEKDGKLAPETLFRLKPAVFGSTQQTPILYQGHLFGVRPDGQLVCLGLNGKPVWESGAANRFGIGNGPYLLAQGMLYVLDDEGTLSLIEASTTAFKPLAKAKILQGPDAWGPMALAGGRLILRDLNQLACLNVAEK